MDVCEGNPFSTDGFLSQSANDIEFWWVSYVNQNKLLNKQSIYWWFVTPWRSGDVRVMKFAGDFLSLMRRANYDQGHGN